MSRASNFDGLAFSKAQQTARAPKRPIGAPAPRQLERDRKKRHMENAYVQNKKKSKRRDGSICRCGCGERRITPHHIVKRAQGRDDRTENLCWLGVACHRLADLGELKVIPTNKRKGANGRIRFTRDGRSWIN